MKIRYYLAERGTVIQSTKIISDDGASKYTLKEHWRGEWHAILMLPDINKELTEEEVFLYLI